jgi:hypothetical protein
MDKKTMIDELTSMLCWFKQEFDENNFIFLKAKRDLLGIGLWIRTFY